VENATLRRCGAGDLQALASLSRETFSHAFAALNNPLDFQQHLEEAFNLERLRVELGNPETRFYFLYSGSQLAGYMKVNVGQAQTELREPEGMEVERLYVIAGFQGRGLGAWMLQQAGDLARKEGKRYLWLGVWEENLAAIRFYERHGFAIFDKHPYYVGTDRQMDWMMRLDL
jgi:ribosomal protein S18 acetylase RimI-like enzyme